MVDHSTAVLELSGERIHVPHCYTIASQRVHLLQNVPGINGDLLCYSVDGLSAGPALFGDFDANDWKVVLIDMTLEDGPIITIFCGRPLVNALVPVVR